MVLSDGIVGDATLTRAAVIQRSALEVPPGFLVNQNLAASHGRAEFHGGNTSPLVWSLSPRDILVVSCSGRLL